MGGKALGEKLGPRNSPRLGKLDDRTEHTLAQLSLHRSILQGVVQRLAKEVLNLIAVQHAHPFAPQRGARALQKKGKNEVSTTKKYRKTQRKTVKSRRKTRTELRDAVVNSARNYADKHLPFLFIYLILLACSLAFPVNCKYCRSMPRTGAAGKKNEKRMNK